MSDKRVALITGAAGGIGRATALELGRRGYALAICDVDGVAIERTTTECGAALPRVVDVLVNNAGILRIGGWQDASEADWCRLFEVNLLSVALATRAFLPVLVAARGHVPNLGSGAALLPFPGYPAYGQVKVGVLWPSTSARSSPRSASACRASARCWCARRWARRATWERRSSPSGCPTRRSTSRG